MNPLADLTGYRDLYLVSLAEISSAKMIKDNTKYEELKTTSSVLNKGFNFFNMYECFVHMQFCVPSVSVEVRLPGTDVTGGCELPCQCWELNPSPLKEQPVLN